jgi:DMSO/TMAO reductase YedYZ molybdopterin-dependent catalytic subunit
VLFEGHWFLSRWFLFGNYLNIAYVIFLWQPQQQAYPMKKTSFLISAGIVTVILVLISSASGLKPIVNADSNGAEWQLTVAGLVERPSNLSLTEIAAMPQTTVNAALICVDFPGFVVAEGNWTGVRLWLLLEAAGVSPDAVKVVFYAADGYSTDLTVETAMREDIILAYEKDGVPLSETLRLVVPDKWGYKWISQVTGVELVNYDFKGFWESRGYSDTANIAEGSPSQPQPNYPSIPEPTPNYSDPPEITPEFPSVIALLIPLILITLFAVILKKKATKLQTQ